jgi:hypothetical protein
MPGRRAVQIIEAGEGDEKIFVNRKLVSRSLGDC